MIRIKVNEQFASINDGKVWVKGRVFLEPFYPLSHKDFTINFLLPLRNFYFIKRCLAAINNKFNGWTQNISQA